MRLLQASLLAGTVVAGGGPALSTWSGHGEYSALGEQMAVPLCLGSGSARGISYVCMGDSGHDWSS